MVKKFTLVFLLAGVCFAVTTAASAAVSPTVKLTLLNTLARADGEEYGFYGYGTGRLTLKSAGEKNVRAQLSLDTVIGDEVLLDVSRAYVKTRFPRFRITVGRDAVSWGEGTYFNAGDVIFGPVPVSGDLTAEVLRDDAVWLTSAYIPLGTYAFFEPVLLAPGLDLSVSAGTGNVGTGAAGSFSSASMRDTSAGGRVVTKIAGIKSEAGYLFSEAEGTHNPFLALQGHLLADLYLAASVSIPGPESGSYMEAAFSFGLFHLQSMKNRPAGDLSFRLEGLVRPSGEWEAVPGGSDAYGILLYPEAVWDAARTLSFLGRSVISPLDRSALFTAGVNWNVYEGLKVLGYIFMQAGEEEDLYGFRKPGGAGISAGLQYIY